MSNGDESDEEQQGSSLLRGKQKQGGCSHYSREHFLELTPVIVRNITGILTSYLYNIGKALDDDGGEHQGAVAESLYSIGHTVLPNMSRWCELLLPETGQGHEVDTMNDAAGEYLEAARELRKRCR
ncbi:unnamed protein product [Chrysoparadoxa australica]